MITREQLVECVSDAKDLGYDIKIRDIIYCLLLQRIDDVEIIYISIFGQPSDRHIVSEYNESEDIEFIKGYIKEHWTAKVHNEDEVSYEDISFEENKASLIKLLKRLDSDVEAGLVDRDKAYKIETDIRSKLVKDFATSKRIDEEVIQVVTKYNDICPYCHHEIHAKEMTKEEAMRKYNLTDIGI